MKQKFEIDPIILGKAAECEHNYHCLEEELPTAAGGIQGVEGVHCRFGPNHFCDYNQEIVKRTPVCMCHVRNEVYNKYRLDTN